MKAAHEKVLIITYYWPPSGGAGVQRWLKFTKYLPSAGWNPVVLTVRENDATYPSRDPSLYGEIPLDAEVHRTRATNYFALYSRDQSKIPQGGFSSGKDLSLRGRLGRFIRGNFFIPDPRKGWNRYAYKKACRLIRSEKIKIIITTSPPHSTQLIGLKLRRRFRDIRWIADLRDPWTGIYYYEMFSPSSLARMIDKRLEKKVLEGADSIITVGPSLASHFEELADDIADKMHVIPNGYDEEDFEGVIPSVPDKFTVTYVGSLSPAYPAEGFARAVRLLRDNGHEVRLKFVGNIPDSTRLLFSPAPGGDKDEFISYCEHPEALRHMTGSSMLLLIIPDHPSAGMILTGKIFEYMATGKPVMLLGPADGDAAKLLAKCGYDGIFGYDDADGMAGFMLKVSSGNFRITGGHHLEYSRRALSNRLGQLLDSHFAKNSL